MNNTSQRQAFYTSPKIMNNLQHNLCPCDTGKAYSACCQPMHLGASQANDAEALMRSRFCAFYLGSHNTNTHVCAKYLSKSQIEPSTQAQWLESFKQQTWLGLCIIQQSQNANQGEVEFAAFYEDASGPSQHHEHSYFVFNGQWQYHSGTFLAPYKYPRNQPCFCQSGKKHKQCHGKP